jgi:diaminopimelate epimerase
VLFVDDLELVTTLGPALEGDTELFPEKCNIEFAQVESAGTGGEPARIRMRVYERGVGETLACGTGACATAAAACLTDRAGRDSVLALLGGDLHIVWREDGHLQMTGPATSVYTGEIDV